jgi:hypothetical protein
MAGPAFAAATTAGETCDAQICLSTTPGQLCSPVCLNDVSQACCAQIDAANMNPDPVARFLAYLNALTGPCAGGTPVAC